MIGKQPIKDINLKNGISSNELIKEMYESGGFTAKKAAIGVDILENMLKQKNCVRI